MCTIIVNHVVGLTPRGGKTPLACRVNIVSAGSGRLKDGNENARNYQVYIFHDGRGDTRVLLEIPQVMMLTVSVLAWREADPSPDAGRAPS